MEIFKPIPGHENYQISTLGTVQNIKTRRILKYYIQIRGYYVVGLYSKNIRKKYTVHQLVAVTFLNHIINGNTTVVDHINNDKLDNRVENLQLLSNTENINKGHQLKHT